MTGFQGRQYREIKEAIRSGREGTDMGAVFLTENLVSLNTISCVFRRTISVHEYKGKCSS